MRLLLALLLVTSYACSYSTPDPVDEVRVWRDGTPYACTAEVSDCVPEGDWW